MSRVVALGEDHRLVGFALAGVRVVRATTDAEIQRAWQRLDPDVGLVILSEFAAQRLGAALDDRPDVLTAVLP